MRELDLNNVAKLAGRVVSEYKMHHSIYDENFYCINVSVKRKSGEFDILPIVISNKLLNKDIKQARFLKFKGQIRTHNTSEGKVEAYLFAKEVNVAEEDTYENEISLVGFICKKGQYKVTFSKRKVINFTLAINRAFNKSDYLPVVAWGDNAKYIESLDISSKLQVVGRFQSRKYVKKLEDGEKLHLCTYEISSNKIINLDTKLEGAV